jgi:hypothetical protein
MTLGAGCDDGLLAMTFGAGRDGPFAMTLGAGAYGWGMNGTFLI